MINGSIIHNKSLENKLQDCFKHTNKTIHWMSKMLIVHLYEKVTFRLLHGTCSNYKTNRI